MTKEKLKTIKGLSYLLVGGGIGALLALLFAPKAGKELRGDIAGKTRQGLDKTEEIASQFGEKLTAVYENTRTKAGEYYTTAQQKINSATEAISELPNNLHNAVQAKTEQISDSFEAGKKEYDREAEDLKHKQANG